MVKSWSVIDAKLTIEANETTMEDLKQFVDFRKFFQQYYGRQNADLKTDEVEPQYLYGERIN